MLDLNNAVVFDCETFPNCFTLYAEMLHSEECGLWEISEYRDDRAGLLTWFEHLRATQSPMVGFNSLNFDYPVIHMIATNPNCTVDDIYQKAQSIIGSKDRWGHMIWPSDRFAPQIDVFRIHHFDNPAKTTSLKALQINMRSPTVVDSPVQFGTRLTREQIDTGLIPYNIHDVKETKRFAHYSAKAIAFRNGLVAQFGADALNFNDTKIGAKILEQRLGEDVCYTRVPRWDGDNYGRKVPRQTPRRQIALKDVIFPYVKFSNPEFQRVLEYMRAQVLTPEDIEDPEAPIKTKGAFTGLVANVGGIKFAFGTGGVHGSVTPQRFIASDEWPIRDIDVAGLYPSFEIVNKMAPAHLGEAFTAAFAGLRAERRLHAKGTVENASLKLGGNGAYGNSNNKYSWMLDPLFTMQTTINCQLLLCMLAEWLMTVPTFQIIQINTDGITYRIHRDYVEQAKTIEKQWEAYTLLELESENFSRCFVRDVNNFVMEYTNGKFKTKGVYWTPAAGEGYGDSISEASPPAWHRDLSAVVVARAAVAAMVHGIDPATFIHVHTDTFDFMLRARANRGSFLSLDDVRAQPTMRYYVARQGASLVKTSPPPAGSILGTWKRANGVTQAQYDAVMRETGGAWDDRVCTKNKSVYADTRTAIEAGYKVQECNDASTFRFDNVDYSWYIAEARKLII